MSIKELYHIQMILFYIVGCYAIYNIIVGNKTYKLLASFCLSGIVFSIARYFFDYPNGHDFSVYWNAGIDLHQGINPYLRPELVSPPTAFPLFMLLAEFDQIHSLFIWSLLNISLVLFLAPLSLQVTQPSLLREDPKKYFYTSLIITSIVSLSIATVDAVTSGQLSIFVTICILLALLMQQKKFPIIAGVFLACASIKPQTMLPFLLLFLNRSDLRIWIVMIFTGFLFAIMGTWNLHLLEENLLAEMKNISFLAHPGMANDYTSLNINHNTIVGLKRALYCLGLRDHSLISCLEFGILGIVGIILWRSILKNRFSKAGCCALICIYSFIFMYHRIYDVPILVLPLTYIWVSASEVNDASRKWLIAAFCSLLPCFFVQYHLIVEFENHLYHLHPLGLFVNAVVLPYTTWFALLSLALLYFHMVQKDRLTLYNNV